MCVHKSLCLLIYAAHACLYVSSISNQSFSGYNSKGFFGLQDLEFVLDELDGEWVSG